MLMRKCDICGREIRKTEGRYKLVFIGRLYDTNKDVCADCIKRIADEIKQADTPQTDCDKCIWNVCNYNKVEWDADTPQTEDDYFLELMDAVMRGEMSDASANQAYYEYINKQAEESDTPQTDLTAKCLNCHNAKACKEKHWDGCIYEPQTDCGWGEPNE